MRWRIALARRVAAGKRIGASVGAPRRLASWVGDRFRWLHGYDPETEGAW